MIYHISLKSHSSEILFQGPVRCNDNSTAARFQGRCLIAEFDKHAALTIIIAAHLYLFMNIACAHTYISVNPL